MFSILYYLKEGVAKKQNEYLSWKVKLPVSLKSYINVDTLRLYLHSIYIPYAGNLHKHFTRIHVSIEHGNHPLIFTDTVSKKTIYSVFYVNIYQFVSTVHCPF